MRIQRTLFSALATVIFLAGCGANPENEELPEMGAFELGHNVVVADDPTPGPLTRRATGAELEEGVRAAIEERLGGYSGTRLLHIGVGVDAYVLALPGVPLVVSPKSVLVITVNVWDNATQQKLNEEPRQFTVFEGANPGTMVLGSGLTQSKEVQLQNLSRNAARKIQNWILEHPEWVGLPPEDATQATPTDAPTPGDGGA